MFLLLFQFLSKIGDLRRPDASIPGKLTKKIENMFKTDKRGETVKDLIFLF